MRFLERNKHKTIRTAAAVCPINKWAKFLAILQNYLCLSPKILPGNSDKLLSPMQTNVVYSVQTPCCAYPFEFEIRLHLLGLLGPPAQSGMTNQCIRNSLGPIDTRCLENLTSDYHTSLCPVTSLALESPQDHDSILILLLITEVPLHPKAGINSLPRAGRGARET